MSQKRPNILVIYPDQLRADSLGCAGNPDVKTPHMDRLAAEGMRFTEAYTHYPLCCPFRASFVTGKYGHATGMLANHFPIDTNQTFLAPLMKEQGYDTAFFGKWHLDGGTNPGFVPPGPRRLGFDTFIGYNRGHNYMSSIFFEDTDQPLHSKRWEPDYQTDHLLDYLKARKSKENPFFAYLCIGAPHYPNDMPDHLRNMYDPQKITLPVGTPNQDAQLAMQKIRLERDCAGDEKAMDKSKAGKDKGIWDTETEEELRAFIAEYYGMVSGVDFNIGRILNWLDANEMAEDTLIVLLSDHGDMLGQNGSFCGMKRSYLRASMHVPFIARWPGNVPAAATCDELVDVSTDCMPTFLDLAEAEIPDSVQGYSIADLFAGGITGQRHTVPYEIMKQSSGDGGYLPVPERGIRTKDWVYARKEHQRIALFDARNDPHEQNNLVNDPSHIARMDAFDLQIEAHMDATNDSWALEAIWPPNNLTTKQNAKRIMETELMPNAELRP